MESETIGDLRIREEEPVSLPDARFGDHGNTGWLGAGMFVTALWGGIVGTTLATVVLGIMGELPTGPISGLVAVLVVYALVFGFVAGAFIAVPCASWAFVCRR